MKKEYAQYLLKMNREGYNKIAREFSDSRWKVWPEMEFLFNDYIQEGDKVLDLGCGNGRFYSLLKTKGIDYIGVDVSEELVKIARKRYSGANFQVADALNLPFSDNYFNKVYSIALLHHIPSEKMRLKFLRETRRVLMEGGLFILTVWQIREKKSIALIFKSIIARLQGRLDLKDSLRFWGKKAMIYFHSFSRRELKKLAERSGFKILNIGFVRNKQGNRNNIYLIAQK
ncbi:class I SAM-dependent methyltransferase [bacterium]|nr:class I SAM-dependent methyltransferase [bacterium]